jgi:hypothetical protein
LPTLTLALTPSQRFLRRLSVSRRDDLAVAVPSPHDATIHRCRDDIPLVTNVRGVELRRHCCFGFQGGAPITLGGGDFAADKAEVLFPLGLVVSDDAQRLVKRGSSCRANTTGRSSAVRCRKPASFTSLDEANEILGL